MKLTSVVIHPENSSESVELSFRDPRSVNPYNVKYIFGLDADEIIPTYYGASEDSTFYNLSLTKREIVVRIGLNPNFTQNQSYSDLRDALYKMIASSRTGKISLYFQNGVDVIAVISGFVSKFESPHFEKTQQVQLTINCVDPMLKALEPIDMVLTGLDPAETVIEDVLSTAPHGFKFKMDIVDDIDSIIITDPNDDTWSFEIIPANGFVTFDILNFSSEYNKKKLYITRGENTIQLADVITPGSIWPIIFPGENTFSFTNPTALVWNKITYFPTYWGI